MEMEQVIHPYVSPKNCPSCLLYTDFPLCSAEERETNIVKQTLLDIRYTKSRQVPYGEQLTICKEYSRYMNDIVQENLNSVMREQLKLSQDVDLTRQYLTTKGKYSHNYPSSCMNMNDRGVLYYSTPYSLNTSLDYVSDESQRKRIE